MDRLQGDALKIKLKKIKFKKSKLKNYNVGDIIFYVIFF